MADRGRLRGGGVDRDRPPLGRPGGPHAGWQRPGRQHVCLVPALLGDGGRAREDPGAGHDRPERAARRQRDVEHVVPAPRDTAEPGHAAGRPAGQPHDHADAEHRRIGGRARATALGVVTGAAVTLLISWYPLWVQFRGPLHEHNTLERPWPGNLALFVDPSSSLLFHTSASEAVILHYNHGLPEILAYLGWPLIIVLVAAAIRFWRDPRVRAAAVTCAVLELCNLGGGGLGIHGLRWPEARLPYHWLQGLPVMGQVIPSRFCILGAGAAGAVLAFSLDLARSAVPVDRSWRRGIPAAVAVLAVLPLISHPQ